MADLISREVLLNDIQAAADNGGMGAVVAGTLKRYVKRAPAVDAVEVVRCKDCKHVCDYGEFYLGCTVWDGSCKADEWCSRGERREENAAD